MAEGIVGRQQAGRKILCATGQHDHKKQRADHTATGQGFQDAAAGMGRLSWENPLSFEPLAK